MDADGLPSPAALAAGHWPAVSVVMPVLDEERDLPAAVAAVLAQHYPGRLDLVLALGPSRDATDRVAAHLATTDPRVRTVPNPSGSTPAALNAAIAATADPVVVRVDGHSALPADYVARAVELLVRTGADNVGGVMDAVGTTPFEAAVACAMTSRFGIGGAVFHTGGVGGPADSVYLGVFRRAALDRVGGFDERYRRAQDWELNLRIRRSGGTVWFSPDLHVGYRPRSSWPALLHQFTGSGRWRRELVRRHPETATPRYLAPPAVTVAVAGGAALGLVGALRVAARGGARSGRAGSGGGRSVDPLLAGLVLPVGYAVGVTAAAAVAGRRLPDPRARALLAPVLAVMHLSWGAGFLRGVSPRTSDTGERGGAGPA